MRALDARGVRAYLATLHTRGLDPTSIARKLAALRSWCRFLVRRGVLPHNPARQIRAPRPSRKLVSFLPIDETVALMDARLPRANARDAAVVELLYASGLRVSELVGLDLRDVDLAGMTVRVLGKGGKERMVPRASRRTRGRGGSRLPQSKGWAPHRAQRAHDRSPSGRRRRHRPAGQPAHAAPHVRHAPSRFRRGSPDDPGAVGPQPAVDDPALHPRRLRPADEDLRRRPPPRARATQPHDTMTFHFESINRNAGRSHVAPTAGHPRPKPASRTPLQ